MTMKLLNLTLSTIATALIFPACSGGGSDVPVEATSDSTATATSTSTDPASSSTSCKADPINPAEPYSLVFKGCDANNVATYYDRTECVRQNSTGLIWQGQMPAGSGELRANDQGKTNYDSTNLAQQVSVSLNGLTIIHPPSIDTVNSLSNSIGFASAVNASMLCGLTNWSVPNSRELQTISKLTELPRIDTIWFPNTAESLYWTRDRDANDATVSFAINFGPTMLANYSRGKPYPVRLVERTYFVP